MYDEWNNVHTAVLEDQRPRSGKPIWIRLIRTPGHGRPLRGAPDDSFSRRYLTV